MTASEHRDAYYDIEAAKPGMAEGQYLVSVRDNDEARLILGLELGVEYTNREVYLAMEDAQRQAVLHGAGEAACYRIQSCGRRLFIYDPLVN